MVEGEYHRAFAIMKLNEDYSNPENVTLEKDSAYLHEYIHFIQDFGTCYGIDQSVDRLSRYLCIFRKNCASVPEERSAIPLQTEQSSAG